jgi:NTE family protein
MGHIGEGGSMRRVGLALGGGGARGLAHILVLELLDELKLKPSIIAGTSIGALIGSLYASGMSGKAIHDHVSRHSRTADEPIRDVIRKRAELLRWVGPPRARLGRGGGLTPDRFLRHLLNASSAERFEDLEIPLLVVATDFWAAKEVVFESGELLPAIRSSIAVPGVFAPVALDGQVLVDGGVLNQVPYDHLRDRCDLTIAVDVCSSRSSEDRPLPNVLEALLGAFDIMQSAALRTKIALSPPDIYVRPNVGNVHIFDFGKAEEIFEQTKPVIADLRGQIARMGGSRPG